MFELAKVNQVPVFGPEPVFGNSKSLALAIKCYNSGNYVDLYEIDQNLGLDEKRLKETLYYKATVEEITSNKKVEKVFQRNLKKTIIYQLLTGKQTREYRGGLLFELSPWEIIDSKRFMKQLMKFYEKVSAKEIEKGRCGIFYALHYEPEATFMNKTSYDSQLYDIQMLSEALPEGWILYVKEHPHQRLFDKGRYASLKCIKQYRNKEFYRQILNNKNVKLLDLSLNSNQIMEREEIKAIASINGTVALEGIEKKKPVILFDGESVVYGKLSNIYKIHKWEDLCMAVQDIADERPMLNYEGAFEKIAHHIYVNPLGDGKNHLEIPKSVLKVMIEQGEEYIDKEMEQ